MAKYKTKGHLVYPVVPTIAICKKCTTEKKLQEMQTMVLCYRCSRDNNYRHKYNVGIDYFEGKIAEQNDLCPLCDEAFESEVYDGFGTRSGRPVLDHDHDSGFARGVLCGKCNTILGMIDGKAPKWFFRAVTYLRQYGSLTGFKVVEVDD